MKGFTQSITLQNACSFRSCRLSQALLSAGSPARSVQVPSVRSQGRCPRALCFGLSSWLAETNEGGPSADVQAVWEKVCTHQSPGCVHCLKPLLQSLWFLLCFQRLCLHSSWCGWGSASCYGLGQFYYIVISLWKTFFLYFEGGTRTGIWKVDWMWATFRPVFCNLCCAHLNTEKCWINFLLSSLLACLSFQMHFLVNKYNNASMWHVVPIYKHSKMGRWCDVGKK